MNKKTTKKTAKKTVSNYQIKITLRHVKPPVWRRFLVKGDTRLGKLHAILQEIMGWEFEHLHGFRVGHNNYGEVNPDYSSDIQDERYVRLDKIASQTSSFIYDYDYGDGWEHDLKIEKVLPPNAEVYFPVCLDGKRACPPEDCGGPHGYAHMLQVLNDPTDEQHGEIAEWLGEDFDPEEFDVLAVNRNL